MFTTLYCKPWDESPQLQWIWARCESVVIWPTSLPVLTSAKAALLQEVSVSAQFLVAVDSYEQQCIYIYIYLYIYKEYCWRHTFLEADNANSYGSCSGSWSRLQWLPASPNLSSNNAFCWWVWEDPSFYLQLIDFVSTHFKLTHSTWHHDMSSFALTSLVMPPGVDHLKSRYLGI